MTKSELTENYTMEQLADMFVELEKELNTASNLQNEILFEERVAENIRNVTGMNINEARKTLQDTKRYMSDTYTEKLKDEIDRLKSQLDRNQTEINQIDEILNELFGVKHDVVDKPEYFKEILRNRLDGEMTGKSFSEKEDMTKNMYGMYKFSSGKLTKDDVLLFLGVLTKELIENGIDFRYDMGEMKVYDIIVKNDKNIAELIPTEPIKVADMLINAEVEYKHNPITKAFYGEDKETYNLFGISELQQIAEHLLVYCRCE